MRRRSTSRRPPLKPKPSPEQEINSIFSQLPAPAPPHMKKVWDPEWVLIPSIQGSTMNVGTSPAKPTKLPRVVHWRSTSGKWVVVSGPFPDMFARSETRDDPDKARKADPMNIYARSGTSRSDTFAKCAAKDILEIHDGQNDFGPVSP